MNNNGYFAFGMLIAVSIVMGGVGMAGMLPASPASRNSILRETFTLVDANGTDTQATLKGKPSVIYFGYTYCPEFCPTTLTDLSRWIQKLGADANDLNYIFVTVDPERDTPKVLSEYLSSFNNRIHGYTGTPDQIAKVAKSYHVYYKRVPSSDGGYYLDHSAAIYLIGPDGRVEDIIPYKEDDDAAVAKLKRLAGRKAADSKRRPAAANCAPAKS
ncbi:SCO family protein [Methyloferula stellata]|uniref:SCO family protein n=1 Tax=Methyloferula stellata TaxID=876270 RepID=UPI00035C37B5|nr:SCO family protein [Methyloferula stellata]